MFLEPIDLPLQLNEISPLVIVLRLSFEHCGLWTSTGISDMQNLGSYLRPADLEFGC